MPSTLPVLRLLLVLCIVLFAKNAFSQKTILGKVFDANSQPVIAANVTVKGTLLATQSNTTGIFTINIPAGKNILTISSVGYETQEVSIGNSTDISVVLAFAINNLGEVVVTGYQNQRKKDITGAVSVVNVTDLKSQPSSDVASQLQGRAAGVTVIQNGVPGAGATVRIRGLGSFTNNNPLYVIDGIQSENISGLNPNDIESLVVLKDASSASIYGVRGSNGVIIVTTKRGKKKGVNVNYDMYYGFQDPGKGPDLLNPHEDAELAFLARRNSGLPTTGSVYGNGVKPVLPDYVYYTGAPNNGIPIMKGNPGVDPSLYQLDYDQLGDLNYSPYIIVAANKNGTNWYNEITRTAPLQNHNLSMSSVNDNSRFFLSMNYFDQQAIAIHNFYKRFTIRLNSEFDIAKNFRVGENLQLFSAEANNYNIISNTYYVQAILPVYTIKGDYAGSAGGSGFGNWAAPPNPVAFLDRTKNNRDNNVNIFGNLYAELDIAKRFILRTNFGGNVNTANTFNYPYIEYEHTFNASFPTYSEYFIRHNNWIWTNQLSYNAVFGKHNISALAGIESQRSGGKQIMGSSTTFFTYNYLPFINLSNGLTQDLSGSQTFTPGTAFSQFAKADYAYDGKYLVSVLVRRDGSSKFSEPNKQSTFPAFSIGWRISNENFMKGVSWINDLKIRGSWGKMGNDAAASVSNAVTTFASNRQSSSYDIYATQNTPQDGFFLSFVGNPLAKWEESVTTNIGFDATIFHNTTEIVFDWYQKITNDLLYNPAGQAIGGGVFANNPPFQNVGGMKNNGLDLMINNRLHIAKDIKLNTTLTFTTYNNTITAISRDQTFFDFGDVTRNFVGKPLNTFFGYKVIGLFQTDAEANAWNQAGAGPGRFKYADINGDKKIDADDRTIIGDPNPDFTYGLNLGTEYKAFDISVFFYGVAGKDIYQSNIGSVNPKRALYESWLPDGSRPNTKTPIQEATSPAGGFSMFGVVNSYYVQNGSYLRLRNLQLGYNLSPSLLKKLKIDKAHIYIQGANLFTITKYTGLNPDIPSRDDREASIDYGTYPVVRQYLFGVNISF
jgi:TonB-dependent starch-binding outer membrane protein SusC